jgi:hypothetical protein
VDCQEILESVDAYALGAAPAEEAAAVERHVAGCVGCWDELTRAQQTADLLSLSVRSVDAPARLGERIISQAQRETAPIRVGQRRPSGRLGWLRPSWPAAAAAFGAVSIFAIVFSASLKTQLDDLHDKNNDLKADVQAATFVLDQQLRATDSRLQEQEILTSVMSDDQRQQLDVTSTTTSGAKASYTWSPETRRGIVECEGIPELPPGKLYQLWAEAGENVYPLATFQPQGGWCLVTMDMSFLDSRTTGIGISIETVPGGVTGPADGWALYAALPSGQ